MPLVCAGISHRTAPLVVREQLARSSDDRRRLLGEMDLLDLERRSRIGEVTVLSTCNRVEVYGASRDPAHRFGAVPPELVALVTDRAGARVKDLEPHLYGHVGVDAVRHLCRVAAGLDSMVLGESEILGQVQEAYAQAVEAGATGMVLDAAFHAAVRAGRRARAETGISKKPVSVSSEAVRAADELAGPLADRRILIVGSGKMGRLGGRVFRAKGVRDLTVVSRTREHAEMVAVECGAVALGWHHLSDAIRNADIVFTSTAAPHAVITVDLMRAALGPGERARPLLLLDIAVPRDVEASVRELPGVQVVDIDDLQQRREANLESRRHAVRDVEAIVEAELLRFEEWRRHAELRPLFTAMRSRTEEIRRDELNRLVRRLGDVSPDVWAQLEGFSRALVNKVLHEPTRRLKETLG